MRWVGWVRTTATQHPFGDGTIDNALRRRDRVVHAVAGKIGGYSDEGNGKPGRALCGVNVPADDPDRVAWWVKEGRHCKRCARRKVS